MAEAPARLQERGRLEDLERVLQALDLLLPRRLPLRVRRHLRLALGLQLVEVGQHRVELPGEALLVRPKVGHGGLQRGDLRLLALDLHGLGGLTILLSCTSLSYSLWASVSTARASARPVAKSLAATSRTPRIPLPSPSASALALALVPVWMRE